MEIVLLALRVLLAGVFGVAGLAKLADRAGSRQALIDFGLPTKLAPLFGICLPLAELAVAIALIPLASAWWGAIGAFALLLLFNAGIGINLARGRTPNCHCFGQLHSEPIGWSTFARNGALAALAVFVIWQGRDNVGLSAVGWLINLSVIQFSALLGGLIVLSVLAAESWFLFQLFHQQGRLFVRLDALEAQLAAAGISAAPTSVAVGLPVGTRAPTFNLSDVQGEQVTLDALRAANKPVTLIFVDPGCGPCNSLLPEIAHWQRAYSEKTTIALLSRGSLEVNRAKSAEHELTLFLLQRDHETRNAYDIGGTPAAVIVSPDGTVATQVAMGADGIRALVARTVGVPMQYPTVGGNGHDNGKRNGSGAVASKHQSARKGKRAPGFHLPDLDGKTIGLDDLRGSSTLVLFWNPNCGYCKAMLNDLKAWEANPTEGAPKLVVFSSGTVEANRAMGLRSPVVLDDGFAVASSFGANGTPSAVLVDAENKIASDVAVGATAILTLAGNNLILGHRVLPSNSMEVSL
jgi:peroxiredoxin